MADPLPDTDADTGGGPGRGSTIDTPRWVKVSGIIAIVLSVLVVLMLTGLIGGGAHGPGRHLPPGGTPSSSVTEQGVHQP